MEIKISTENGRVPVTVVAAVGNIDTNTFEPFMKKTKELIDGGARYILVDLTNVPYMSSAGLRVLVAMHKAAKKSGGGLCLAQPSDRVREVLDLAGLTPVFVIYPDVVAAVGSF